MAEEPLTPFGNALAGALGGVFSSAVVYPLDTVKTRIQAGQGVSSSSGKANEKAVVRKDAGLLSGVGTIAQREGMFALYKGFGASMVNTFTTQFAYFYWYTVVRGLYIRRTTPAGAQAVTSLSTAIELLLGALAGGLAQIFTIPVSVIATRQQLSVKPAPGPGLSSGPPRGKVTASGLPAGSGDAPGRSVVAKASDALIDDETFLGVARGIWKDDGITGFWRGLKPSLVLTVNPAITYGVFERVKTIILASSTTGKMTPGQSFLVGAISKTLATVVTFPYILSKIRLQAKNTPYKNAFDVLARIARQQGIAGWYQGMQAQITKAVLAQALLFFFRDYFEIWTRQLLKAAKK